MDQFAEKYPNFGMSLKAGRGAIDALFIYQKIKSKTEFSLDAFLKKMEKRSKRL